MAESEAINTLTSPPLIEMIDISKGFPGVQALKGVSYSLKPGEIHAIVGENGAGKSTLIKTLTGVHQPDSGTLKLSGKTVSFAVPAEALACGITAIYQEFTLVESLTVRENLFLGREKSRRGFIDIGYEKNRAGEILEQLGIRIDPEKRVSTLTIAEQQLTEIAKALVTEAKILILDEPTAALAPREVDRLFHILRDLAGRGIGIIFISHRLDEIFAIADRITVMRDGETITTQETKSLDRAHLVEYMVGRSIDEEYPKTPAVGNDNMFEVRGLSGGRIRDISFSVRTGEVLGLAGLMGSGRTEIARLLFGADPKTSGEIYINGRKCDIDSPRDAIEQGICFLTEDRKAQGLVLQLSSKENFALPNLKSWSRFGMIDVGREAKRFSSRAEELNIKTAASSRPAAFLSGGNQQKLLIARWLETESQVIIFDEPTRGIDVGAKYEIYQLINKLAAEGRAIIVISSELPEILGICDRVLVMREGRITGEIIDVPGASQEDIMKLAI